MDRAVERAADAALRWQLPDGSWRGRNRAGIMYVAASVSGEAALGSLRPADAAAARRSLLAAQLPDGGAAPWPEAAQSNAEATLFLLAGLRAVGVPERDPAVIAASRRLERLGGPRRGGPIALTFAALVGAVPPSALPPVSSAISLVPGHDALVERLLGVNALLPLRTLPFLWDGIRAGGGGLAARRRALAGRRLVPYLRSRQNPSGGIAGVPIFTLLGLLCLKLAGAPADDPAIARGLAYARRVYHRDGEGLMVEPFESTYWDTAHMVRALAQLRSERHLAAARRGAAFLLRGQSREPSPPDWQTPPPGAPPFGGWSWQPGNERNPDFDTTAEVLSALGALARASEADRAALAAPIDLGLRWLRAFQNPDGGWAAFSHGKPRPPAGALYLRRGGPLARARSWLAENGDPSTADIVGRVLWGLGEAQPDLRPDDPAVDAARRFLAAHRVAPHGAWWGRWAVNYIASTSYIISGLVRAGSDPGAEIVARPADWLIACQNPDGGWGESPESYEDPSLAGRGPSTAALTGLVTWALQVAGRGGSPAVARGVAHLLARQGEDGSFQDSRVYSTMFPLRAYWINDTYPTFFALEALLARRG